MSAFTLTVQLAANPPSTVVALMMVVPKSTGVTTPPSTVATVGFEEVQTMSLIEASPTPAVPVGATVALIVSSVPTTRSSLSLSSVIPVTG